MCDRRSGNYDVVIMTETQCVCEQFCRINSFKVYLKIKTG